jgi:glycosyltransferase involved in cell wall biosynthesis
MSRFFWELINMRIGIDVRYLSHGLVGGIHTYLKNLIPELINANSGHQLYLYADTKRPFEIPTLPDHVTLRLLQYTSPVSSLYLDFFMRNKMAKDNLDIAHFPASFGFGPGSLPTIITLQDEINILPLRKIIKSHRKHLRTMAMMTYLHAVTRAALGRVNKIITVSEYSKQQIVCYSGLNPDKIAIVPHACPRDIERVADGGELDETRRRLGLRRPFVLAEAFKNPAVLVRAWKLLPQNQRDQYEIIFFSRSEDVLPVVHEAVSAGFARLLVRPARRDLSALYSMTEAFVFPSWIEGFGIPLLEAMTCGAPIIASDRGSIPEVAGDAALLIDAEDHATLANHLTVMFKRSAEWHRLQERGFARAAQFSWPRITQAVFEVYEQARLRQ